MTGYLVEIEIHRCRNAARHPLLHQDWFGQLYFLVRLDGFLPIRLAIRSTHPFAALLNPKVSDGLGRWCQRNDDKFHAQSFLLPTWW
jgi:hypothetical protein